MDIFRNLKVSLKDSSMSTYIFHMWFIQNVGYRKRQKKKVAIVAHSMGSTVSLSSVGKFAES